MRDLSGHEVLSFPVWVYDVHLNPIAIAYTKEQFITIWNSDLDNRAVGTLSGLIGPFSFTLTLKPGATAPPWVIGDINNVVPGATYYLINSNGNPLVNSNGNNLTYQ